MLFFEDWLNLQKLAYQMLFSFGYPPHLGLLYLQSKLFCQLCEIINM